MTNISSPKTILTKSPLRISLAGGGTDLKSYASRFGGTVLGLGIDRYVAILMYPRSFCGGVVANWEYAENVSSVCELKNIFARTALTKMEFYNNFQISSFSDVPSCTGLGGSGAFLVSLMHLNKTDIRSIEERYQLAEDASAIEMESLNLPVGKQDHYMAALGGLQLLKFNQDLSTKVTTLQIGPQSVHYFSKRLLLFYTGQRRVAAEILKAQAACTEKSEKNILDSLHAIHNLVTPMTDAIMNDNPDMIGPLLNQHWEEKSRLNSKISNEYINNVYKLALQNGSDGGKVLGAGGGGFLLVSVKDGYQENVRKIMDYQGMQELEFGCDLLGTTRVSLAP